jgi:hypothetical protein
VGDLDGDNRLDVVVGVRDVPPGTRRIGVLLNQGGRDNWKAVDYPMPEGPELIGLGQLDGDGRLDLVVRQVDGTLALLRNEGGTLVRRQEIPVPKLLGVGLGTLLVRDLDGDKRADIVGCYSVAFGKNSLAVFLNRTP